LSAWESQTASPQNQPLAFDSRKCHARSVSRPWTAEEDAKLLDWAGCEPVIKIAQRLNRSVRAVRFRLGALDMSAKVSDGWSQRALRKLLRMSSAKQRRLVGSGMLRVRDPRITARSLIDFCISQGVFDHSTVERMRTASARKEAYCWDRVCQLSGISPEQLRVLVSKGRLKVVDPFVTDRSFEEFCRKHGDQINLSLIDPATAKWLVSEYSIAANVASRLTSRAQKTRPGSQKMRGRSIAGNVFFKHVRRCKRPESQAMGVAA
jgi:hypothetical protein